MYYSNLIMLFLCVSVVLNHCFILVMNYPVCFSCFQSLFYIGDELPCVFQLLLQIPM